MKNNVQITDEVNTGYDPIDWNDPRMYLAAQYSFYSEQSNKKLKSVDALQRAGFTKEEIGKGNHKQQLQGRLRARTFVLRNRRRLKVESQQPFILRKEMSSKVKLIDLPVSVTNDSFD